MGLGFNGFAAIMNTSITIGTDVAHLMLFHPDDLAHRSEDPIAWYGYDFAYRAESRAGRLVAWGTGSDGGFLVRLTTGLLTEAERRSACASWTFPFVVRHGRVLLDNSDALPGAEQMVRPEEVPDLWCTIPNGSYRVTVTPIDRTSEDAGDDPELPDYVVTFDAAEEIGGIPVADTPPELRPYQDWTPRQPVSMETEQRFAWPAAPLPGGGLPVIAVEQGIAALPGLSARFAVGADVAALAFPEDRKADGFEHYLLTARAEPGVLGVVARRSGLSRFPGRLPVLSLHGIGIARITGVAAAPVLDRAEVEAVAKPDMTVGAGEAEAFRDHLAALAENGAGRLAASRFEIERLRAMASAEALTGWALMQFDLPFDDRLALYASTARDRIAGIRARLEGAG